MPTRSTGKMRRRRRKGYRAEQWQWAILLGATALVFTVYLGWLSPGWPFHGRRQSGTSALTMDQARAINAAIPFVAGDVEPARPFMFHGTSAGREQAVQCLATVALYEAGSDRDGQKAVIQVVLNRVRQPAFPKTICGVVYQGSSLPTGCQFSFTCDGSRQRRPERSGWEAARKAAKRALSGYVFRPVGTATHYHTDWVVPYWSGSLDKIAKINTHIFYRRPA